jgi:alkanesulfonate monooxygenase SsuD/methylene tetrahydromethanopterin reductase-like flavin-dependent oxidoreductase (luciferase family)
MKLGAFVMPSHPPERSLIDGYRWDLEHLVLLDRLGFHEAWIGEHFTALPRTQRIKLCPGAHLLPYHHPIELAHRVAFLDQLAQGRYMLGVGISALPSDLALFGVDAAAGQNRRMTLEALEIMLRVWRGEPFSFDGEFWKVRPPKSDFEFLKLHLKPFQQPHPPIGIAGLSPGSETLKIAGERGFIPLSISLNPAHTASHWTSIEAGAARSGRTPDRREWRLVREIYVAATDDEARKRVREGAMGRCWREYLLPFYLGNGFGAHFKRRPSDPDSAIDVDYLIESWLVGSPATVREKLAGLQRATGGFGGLLVMVYDFSTEPEWWAESLSLLVGEVMPHFAD